MSQLEFFSTVFGIVASGVAVIYVLGRIFFRPKMDPRVKDLAEAAFRFAADTLGVEAKGSPPPVVLRKEPWDRRGTISTIGRYSKYLHLPIIGYMYEKVEVVADASYIFKNLAHEMAHAIRARSWKAVTEKEAEMVEAKAREYRLTDLQISTLLEDF